MTRYELLDRIGVGGMAEIFRGKAVAAGGFEKPVAIKRILPHLSQDKRFVELLIAEAKVLSLLKHRNIVQIFDVGLGDDGQYFLVMEFVDGKDLGAIQRNLEAQRSRVPLDLVLHIGAEICDALEHAHSARAPDGKPMSLVHRDVSPSNVLLSHAGEVKLTDFGIAKRAEQEATGHGAVRGKFAYISPEQARNEHIDPRSDVFSVGVVLWELLTTRRLFSGLGNLEALRAVRDAQVTRPAEVDRNISPDVDALIMAALSRDPGRRPAARELSDKLRSLRYSLEVTVGDPATELAKIVDNAEQVARQNSAANAHKRRSDFAENTASSVIRIQTADAFSMEDSDGTGISAARQVIGRFEDDEVTRLAHPTEDQLRMLRSLPDAGSGDDEPTTAQPPLRGREIAAMLGKIDDPLPNQSFDPDERTRQMSPPGRPAQGLGRTRPPGTAPPGLPGLPQNRSQPPRARGPTPGPPVIGEAVRAHELDDGERRPPVLPPLHLPPMTLTDPVPSKPAWAPPAQAAARALMFEPLPSHKGVASAKARRGGLRPWMLVVGALAVGGLAFGVTRALMSAGSGDQPGMTRPK